MNYYKNQLNRLKDSEYYKTIIISDSIGNKTNNMDINKESIKELINFLKKELKSLEGKEQWN